MGDNITEKVFLTKVKQIYDTLLMKYGGWESLLIATAGKLYAYLDGDESIKHGVLAYISRAGALQCSFWSKIQMPEISQI